MLASSVRWVTVPLFVLVIYPLLRLVWISFQPADGSAMLSLTPYTDLLQDPRMVAVLKNTLCVTLGSTALAVVTGCAGALITERTDLPWRQFWRLLFLLPVLVPSYVLSIAWLHWLGPVGMLNQWVGQLTGKPFWQLGGLAGMTIIMAVAHTPIAYLLIRAAFNAIPVQLEEAAMAAGASRRLVFGRIILPLLMPALVSSSLLSFASAVDNFGIPAFIGIPEGITVLSTFIYQKVIGLGAGQFEQAAALSVLTGLMAMAPVYLQGRLFRGPRYRREEYCGDSQVYITGVWKWPLTVLLAIWHTLTILGPFAAMVVTSLTPAYGVTVNWGNLTLRNYSDLWYETASVGTGLVNSLLLAGTATLLILALAWPVARVLTHAPARLVKLLDAVGAVPYCLPGMVLALAVLLTWVRPLPGLPFSLYGGMVILLIAYIPRFFTFGVRTWVSAWSRFSPALEEAGRVCGAGPLTVAGRIVLPIFRGEALGGGLLIFLLSFTELTLSALLAGSQYPTLGLTIFNLESAGLALESAALGTLLTFFSVILAMVVSGYLLKPANETKEENLRAC